MIFYDHLLASSDFYLPVFWKENKVSFVTPFRNIICFVHFLFVGDFSFFPLEAAENTNAYV